MKTLESFFSQKLSQGPHNLLTAAFLCVSHASQWSLFFAWLIDFQTTSSSWSVGDCLASPGGSGSCRSNLGCPFLAPEDSAGQDDAQLIDELLSRSGRYSLWLGAGKNLGGHRGWQVPLETIGEGSVCVPIEHGEELNPIKETASFIQLQLYNTSLHKLKPPQIS